MLNGEPSPKHISCQNHQAPGGQGEALPSGVVTLTVVGGGIAQLYPYAQQLNYCGPPGSGLVSKDFATGRVFIFKD